MPTSEHFPNVVIETEFLHGGLGFSSLETYREAIEKLRKGWTVEWEACDHHPMRSGYCGVTAEQILGARLNRISFRSNPKENPCYVFSVPMAGQQKTLSDFLGMCGGKTPVISSQSFSDFMTEAGFGELLKEIK